jgi:hypothetical protein
MILWYNISHEVEAIYPISSDPIKLYRRSAIAVELAIAVKIARRLEVACTSLGSALDFNVVDRDVLAAAISTENVVVARLGQSRAGDVLDCDVLNQDAVGGVASGAAVEVILLDDEAVAGHVLDTDVLKQNVGDETGSVGVGLDAHAVLGVENDGVGEGDVGHIVV